MSSTPDDAVREPQQPAQHVLVLRVHALLRLRLHARDVAADDEPHHVDVVRRQVQHHPDIAHPLRERPDAPSVHLQHAPQLARLHAFLQLDHRRD